MWRENIALIRDLLQPKKRAETEVKVIFEEVEKHYSPQPSEIVERFKFHNRSRTEGEGVAEFLEGLQKLSEHCNFGETLDNMLKDRLMCGINDAKIQRRLLAEPELTLKKAIDLALALESASNNLLDLSGKTESSSVNLVHAQRKSRRARGGARENAKCYRCGGKHLAATCKFIDALCFNCDKKGHIAKVCHSPKSDKQKGEGAKKGTKKDTKNRTNVVRDKESDDESYAMFNVTGKAETVKALKVDVKLCGKLQQMEVDTGASKTNEGTYAMLGDEVKMEYAKPTLSTYTGEKIPVIGTVMIPVEYGEQKHKLSAVVVQGPGPNLLGRDWLKVLKLDWKSIFSVQETPLVKLLEAHKVVFDEGLGTLRGTKAKIYVETDAEPKFFKARPVPYALKSKVEDELERLQKEGIISPVEFSEWAAPIFPFFEAEQYD